MPVLKISKRHPESEATLSRVEFGIEKTQFSKNNPGQIWTRLSRLHKLRGPLNFSRP